METICVKLILFYSNLDSNLKLRNIAKMYQSI